MKELDERHIHDGHRKRMQEKLIRHDVDIFESYELLEMLLFFRLPYKNTNPIAKRLVHRFGSLRGVFYGERDELLEISGVGEKCAEFIIKVGRIFDIESADSALCADDEYVGEGDTAGLMRSLFSRERDGSFAIVAIDNAHRVITSEVLSGVDFNSGSLNAAYYTEFALKSSASMIVTASNRRYGSPLPKPADRESAAMVLNALNAIDVVYGDHFVIAGNHYSRVIPTLDAVSNKGKLFSEIPTTENAKADEIANKSSHNELIFEIFDDIVSTFCPDHSEKCRLLFDRFGSVASILITDYLTLSDMVGASLACFIRILAGIAKRRVTDTVRVQDISSEAELCDYLAALCIPLNKECVFLISCDAKGKIIAVDKVSEGTLNSSAVTLRSLVELAMRHSPKRAYVAHNHPYGKSELSDADASFTRKLSEAFISLGIELAGHFCISERGVRAAYFPFDDFGGVSI